MFANYPDGTTRAFLTVFASQDICKDCQSGKEKLLLTVTHNSGLIQSLFRIFATHTHSRQHETWWRKCPAFFLRFAKSSEEYYLACEKNEYDGEEPETCVQRSGTLRLCEWKSVWQTQKYKTSISFKFFRSHKLSVTQPDCHI